VRLLRGRMAWGGDRPGVPRCWSAVGFSFTRFLAFCMGTIFFGRSDTAHHSIVLTADWASFRGACHWEMDYNHYRPRGSPGYMSPATFATSCFGPDSAVIRRPRNSDGSRRA